MKELRTTLYDLKGYFIPGATLLVSLLVLVDLNGYKLDLPALMSLSVPIKSVILVTASYVTGHGLHALANITIDSVKYSLYPPKFYFPEKYESDFSLEHRAALHNTVVNHFKISSAAPYSSNNDMVQNSYWPCLQFVMSKENSETENILGLTGFYRGITSAFIVMFLSYLIVFITNHNRYILFCCIVALLGAILFFLRVRRFNAYFAKTIYSNFLFLAKDDVSKTMQQPTP